MALIGMLKNFEYGFNFVEILELKVQIVYKCEKSRVTVLLRAAKYETWLPMYSASRCLGTGTLSLVLRWVAQPSSWHRSWQKAVLRGRRDRCGLLAVTRTTPSPRTGSITILKQEGLQQLPGWWKFVKCQAPKMCCGSLIFKNQTV